MKGLSWLVGLLAVIGLGLAFTKPTETDFEAELEARLLAQIDAADVSADDDPFAAILTATCKAGPAQCAQIIRALMTLDYEDKVLFSRARVGMGSGAGAECIGVATRIFCRKG